MMEGTSKADQSRELILQAATREFALHGYSKASTNNIMKQAGMAKGLLFHHFTSKGGLYLAALQNVLTIVQQRLDQFLAAMPDDLFQRLTDLLEWKLEIALKQPMVFRFLFSITSLPPSLRKEAEASLSNWRTGNARLLADYDTSLWDPAIDQMQAIRIIVMLFESIDQKWLQGMEAAHEADTAQDPARESASRELLKQALQMLNVLRTGFYR